jgi:AraC-like DNA-binding protein
MLLRVVDFVAARGHDAEALCRSAGLQLAVLRQPDTRVPYALAERLGERAVELTRDPNLGLRLAQDVKDSQHYDAGLLLLMACPNVGAALEHMVRYQRYWGDGERSTLVQSPGETAVRYLLPGPTGITQRHNDECAMAEIAIGVNAIAARPAVPRLVRFRHPAPRDQSEHAVVFGCPLRFSAPHTEIVFDEATLETPLRHAHAFYAEVFRQQVERAIAGMPKGQQPVDEVRAIVRASLAGGSCTLASTARALGLTTRTLQRRLESDASSFDGLVDGVRHELALRYLDQQLSVREIASLLGYRDAGAFHRAFKRWTGTTPERARSLRS